MENKRTALDILFQEIKESRNFMSDSLFGYFEIVYKKLKEIEDEKGTNSSSEAQETH